MIHRFCNFCNSGYIARRNSAKYCSLDCSRKAVSKFFKELKRTPEHKKKISESLKGKKFTEERIKNMSIGRKGKMTGDLHWNWNSNRDIVVGRDIARNVMHRSLRRVLERIGKKKSNHVDVILGYSTDDFCHHIESLFKSGMSWKNHGYGDGKWHVDHIIAIKNWPFDASPKDVNALSNLQPLWHYENLKKGASTNV